MGKYISGERVRMSAHNHDSEQCAKVRKTMMLSSAHNHGHEQCAGVRKKGGAQPYTTYMCMCAPHLAGVGSRAVSSRTTTTHPALRWAPYLEQRKKELMILEFEFFMAMVPPTVTHQEKQVRVAGWKPVFYEPPELKAARQKLMAYLGQHVPDEPYHCGIRLITKWCFPRGRHKDGTYRLSKPDTDNLQKLLKDCMTKAGFWDDDALVASEIVEKFWAEVPGIYVRIEPLS